MKEKIVASVVTHNRKELLKNCLDSLLSQSRPLDLIIIVDNASTDDTQDMLRKHYLDNPIFKYVRLDKNIGGAGGFYTGIKRAYKEKCDWVWCMDDDTVPYKDALEKLVENPLAKLRETGLLCSNVLWKDNLQHSMNTPALWEERWGDEIKNNALRIKACSFVSVLIRRSSIEKCGLPIKEFFIWGDDIEYTTRISKRFKCYFVMDSTVIHKTKKNIGPTLDDINDSTKFKYEFDFRNRVYRALHEHNVIFGIKGFLAIFRRGFELLFHRKFKLFFFIFLVNFIKGFFFNPKVEFPKRLKKKQGQ